MKNSLLYFTVLGLSLSLSAFESEPQTEIIDSNQLKAYLEYKREMDSIEATFNYQFGEVNIKNGLANISIPEGFKYLDGETSDMILTDIWGNPPSKGDSRSLGMLIPANLSPLMGDSYSINVTYSEEGYVEDDDAEDIDYSELLEDMQEESKAVNEYRVEQGYPTVEIVGWASDPFYDSEAKKLHWAKEIKFGDDDGENTLNYNIRILGRSGYLQLNAIGVMSDLPNVQKDINPILASVNFNDGHRYADFNPEMDNVAAVGIGGLIAGKILLKTGLLAKLGILLAKFWKVIAIGVVAVFGGIKKFFGKGE